MPQQLGSAVTVATRSIGFNDWLFDEWRRQCVHLHLLEPAADARSASCSSTATAP